MYPPSMSSADVPEQGVDGVQPPRGPSDQVVVLPRDRGDVRAGSPAEAHGYAGLLTPLELPGWLDFNAWRSGLQARRFTSGDGGGPGLRAVFYLDRRGRIRLPANNPYLPVVFRSSRQRGSGRTAQWHEAAGVLADEMRRRGAANQLYLPPDVEDVRPWSWRGFFVGVRYTYYLDLPYDPTLMAKSLRSDLQRAKTHGMTVERVRDVDLVLECLAESEIRQGFSHNMGRRELLELQAQLGDDALRIYIGFDARGRPANANVALHASGAWAISWIGGTKSANLTHGADPFVMRYMFDDLHAAGAIGVDLCGANMPSVAAFKAKWGARLVTNYGVRTYSLRTGARFVADWRASRRPAVRAAAIPRASAP